MEYISKKSCSIWTVCPCFCWKSYLFKSETKKVAFLKGLGTDLKIFFSLDF